MPGIVLGPKPVAPPQGVVASGTPVAPPQGVVVDAGDVPAGVDTGNSSASNSVAPPASAEPTIIGNASSMEPQVPGTAAAQNMQSTAQSTTIRVQPKEQAANRSAPSQPSHGIVLGPQTIGAVDQPHGNPTGHVSITISGGGGGSVSAPNRSEAKPPKSNRGGIANGITFFFFIAGLILQVVLDDDTRKYNFVLAIGVFGFAGGITNWLAVKMLFDKIPGLYGSGVIPMQYKNIRKTVKQEIMHTFFDEDYLKGYIRQRAPDFLKKLSIGERIMNVINSSDFDSKMLAKLEEISTTPQGMLLQMVKPFMGGSLAGLVPMVKPPLVSIAAEIAKEMTTIEEEGDGETVVQLIPVDVVRGEIDALMTERLETLTPEVVKQLLEDVIRDHLGWLVVWGNIFGSVIGVIALAVTGEV